MEAKLFHQCTEQIREDGARFRDRESYFLSIPGQGAVEAWRTSEVGTPFHETGYYGGIEIHYKHPQGDDFWGAEVDSCWATGGKCWTTGSSMAFDTIEHHFDDPAYIRFVLEGWARGRLTPATEEAPRW